MSIKFSFTFKTKNYQSFQVFLILFLVTIISLQSSSPFYVTFDNILLRRELLFWYIFSRPKNLFLTVSPKLLFRCLGLSFFDFNSISQNFIMAESLAPHLLDFLPLITVIEYGSEKEGQLLRLFPEGVITSGGGEEIQFTSNSTVGGLCNVPVIFIYIASKMVKHQFQPRYF